MFGELPENYITIEEAKVLGWKNIHGLIFVTYDHYQTFYEIV